MVTLTTWDKLMVVGCGLGVVVFTLFLVICVVAPFCPLHRFLPERARLPLSSPAKKRKKKWLLAGNVMLTPANSEKALLKNGTTYISYSQEIRGGSLPAEKTGMDSPKSPEAWPLDSVTLRNSNQTYIASQHKRPSVLTTRESTVDSTYSSMTPTGSRPSTPISSKRSSQSDLMLPENLGDNSSIRSADTSPMFGTVSVTVQLAASPDDNIIRLIVGIKEAQDLPSRDLVACGDPFFKVSLIKENNKAFRKRSKSKADLLAQFSTNVQKKTRHPIYNQEFEATINKSDLKDLEIHVAGFDKDKYANPTEFGVSVIYLKNLKLTIESSPVTLCLELTEPKRINGEIQLGLMYLPTAERMAFSNFKLTNIPINQLPGSEQKLCVRVIALHNGKMVGKKKTEAMKHCPPTVTCFDDSLAFDLPTDQLSHLSFVVVVVASSDDSTTTSKSKKDIKNGNVSDTESTMMEGGGLIRDRFIGKVALGPNAKSTSLQHWEIALHRPREQIVLWHVLR